ncbi:MAG: D-hexose-6-phosphate mutarotase [Acidovorax soli]|uniref:D-hexose-6-phosphate mutarotase n=1 Tax=Acidovorax soli TaxID=592050 RepID=UPI0026F32B15|nr:D-hexose-6-phosphate mutarotase [Acidovorax soli]MCM2345949.1 D-hexose-6-phosphate mutarotase [Acidovorax soli]
MPPDSAAVAAWGCTEHFQGQPCIRLQAPQGDSALVALHGAQVLSWVAGGRERLYLSPQAVFDGQSAIRGGIPLCFPQFNQRGPLSKHGFARNLAWHRVLSGGDGDAPSVVCLELADSEATRAWWPGRFAVQLTVALGAGSLRVQLAVRNTGDADADAWNFTTALHTYLRVENVDRVHLSGLDGCARWDAVADARGVQRCAVRVAGEYDCVFQAPAGPMQLRDGAQCLQIAQSASLSDTVVWNPGAGLCTRLADMPPDGYRSMLCVEAARIDSPVTLAPQAQWQGWQELRVLQAS